ncbi:hypothetical protein ACIBOV_29200 [Micromonospora chersina]|uniref:hypothetical protein n=1 Tax=Micromonospora chersina TaxID=47854 RepID=UPI0037AE92AB
MAELGAETLIGAGVRWCAARRRWRPRQHRPAGFLTTMRERVGAVHAAGGTLRDAFLAAHTALAPRYGSWPIFEHCLPFIVQRL